MLQKNNRLSAVTDEELMARVCHGEAAAFDELYQRHARNLTGYFVRMLNFDRDLAQDALQDLFLKIAERPELFDGSRSFKTWVFSMASNSCKNFYRHRQVVMESHEEIRHLADERDEQEFVRVASRMDAREFRKLLEETLETLPYEKKEAFILKYQEDKSIAEIALIQGCPEGSVKSRLHYTVKLLEERLKIFNT